jgi:hypothetical protein
MGLKHWLSHEEYAALDADARAQYVDYGDGYRLDPSRRDLREQKTAMIVLLLLVAVFSAVGAYAIAKDDDTLKILAFCGAMPTLLGFFVQLATYLSWS